MTKCPAAVERRRGSDAGDVCRLKENAQLATCTLLSYESVLPIVMLDMEIIWSVRVKRCEVEDLDIVTPGPGPPG